MYGLEHDTVVHIYLVEPVDVSRVEPRDANGRKVTGELHYTHHAAHGLETIGIKTEASERLLDDLECEYAIVFAEPTYLIIKGHDPFRI